MKRVSLAAPAPAAGRTMRACLAWKVRKSAARASGGRFPAFAKVRCAFVAAKEGTPGRAPRATPAPFANWRPAGTRCAGVTV